MFQLFNENENYKNSRIYTSKLKKLSSYCDDLKWWCDYLKLSSYSSLYFQNLPVFQQISNSTGSPEYPILWEDLRGFKWEVCDYFPIIQVSKEVTISTNNKIQEKYMFSVDYEGTPYNLVRVYFNGASVNSEHKNIVSEIDIYWKAFRLEQSSYNNFNVFNFLYAILSYKLPEEQINAFKDAFITYYITRYDFRLDFFSPEDLQAKFYKYLTEKCLPTKIFKTPLKWKPNIILNENSWDIDYISAWKQENKYVFCRLYNKKQDIIDKKLYNLYSDYHLYKWLVYRLEFVFYSRFTTSNWELPFLPNSIDILTEQIFWYLWLDYYEWPYSRNYIPKKIPFHMLPLREQKSNFSRLKWIFKKFILSGVNPYFITDCILCDIKNEALSIEYKWRKLPDIPSNLVVSEVLKYIEDYFERYHSPANAIIYQNLKKLWFDIEDIYSLDERLKLEDRKAKYIKKRYWKSKKNDN